MTMTDPVVKRVDPYDRRRAWHGADTSWMRKGACSEVSDSVRAMFFADDKTAGTVSRETRNRAQLDVLEARGYCWECPVRSECLQFALDHGMHGIWGATTGAERKQMKRKAK